MGTKVIPAALALLATAVGLAGASTTAARNGLVSFGVCCGSEVGIYVITPGGAQKRILKPKFDDANLDSAWSPSGHASPTSHRVACGRCRPQARIEFD